MASFRLSPHFALTSILPSVSLWNRHWGPVWTTSNVAIVAENCWPLGLFARFQEILQGLLFRVLTRMQNILEQRMALIVYENPSLFKDFCIGNRGEIRGIRRPIEITAAWIPWISHALICCRFQSVTSAVEKLPDSDGCNFLGGYIYI